MKKTATLLLAATLIFSGCASYTAQGAYTGSQFGHIIGSAVGGITGGRHGHDWGSLIGTVGGAAAGAAVGTAIDNTRKKKYEERTGARPSSRSTRTDRRQQPQQPNDIIVFDDSPNYSTLSAIAGQPTVEIRNPQFVDHDGNGIINRGETCTIVFEIHNISGHTLYDIQPVVSELTQNRHLHVSPNLRISSIAPQQGLRYRASIKADNGLTNGKATLLLDVAVGDNSAAKEMLTLDVKTSKQKRK